MTVRPRSSTTPICAVPATTIEANRHARSSHPRSTPRPQNARPERPNVAPLEPPVTALSLPPETIFRRSGIHFPALGNRGSTEIAGNRFIPARAGNAPARQAIRRASSPGCARRDGARASRSLPSPGARGERSSEPRQRAVAPIFCDSLRRESRTLRFPGGYDRPGPHPDKGLSDRGDGIGAARIECQSWPSGDHQVTPMGSSRRMAQPSERRMTEFGVDH